MKLNPNNNFIAIFGRKTRIPISRSTVPIKIKITAKKWRESISKSRKREAILVTYLSGAVVALLSGLYPIFLAMSMPVVQNITSRMNILNNWHRDS
jgi:hypothetical protein